MVSIEELIKFYSERMVDVDAEIARIMEQDLPEDDEEDGQVDWLEQWRREKSVLRDTISYLRTYKRALN